MSIQEHVTNGLKPIVEAIAAGKPILIVFAMAEGGPGKFSHGTVLIATKAGSRTIAALAAGAISKAVEVPELLAELYPENVRSAFVGLVQAALETAERQGEGQKAGLLVEREARRRGGEGRQAMFLRRNQVDERLGGIVDGMIRNLKEGHIDGQPIKLESLRFVTGVVAGVQMAQAAVKALPPADLFENVQN